MLTNQEGYAVHRKADNLRVSPRIYARDGDAQAFLNRNARSYHWDHPDNPEAYRIVTYREVGAE